jgi:acetoin utilization protein AcuB
MNLSELMTTCPISVAPTTSIRDALGKMIEFDIRHLPVLEADRLIGIVSDRDVRDFSLPSDEQYDPTGDRRLGLGDPVSSIMTVGVYTLDESADISSILDAMIEEKLSAVPIVRGDDRVLVGIISYIDVLKALRDTLG